MARKREDALQFRIVLLGILPMIWRRILVPAESTFWDLHVAIQDAMGWSDSHLHMFRAVNTATRRQDIIGIPDEDGFNDMNTLAGWKTPVEDYLAYHSPLALYEYDFGDSWLHEVVLEQCVQSSWKLPMCLSGERGCPPEDVGGAPGYEEFLAAIKNSKHPEHERMLEWVGGKFDPEGFDPRQVKFDSPEKRLRGVVGNG